MARPVSRWRAPFVAVVAVLLAFLLRTLLQPITGPTGAPLQMFFLAVFVAGWAGGLGAGLLATALSLVVAYLAFFSHAAGFFSPSTQDLYRVIVFVVIGAIFSIMSQSRLSALAREEHHREALQREQQQRLAALEEAASERERLRLVTDHIPVILATCDRDGRFTFVNSANADRFGLRPADMTGRRVAEVLGADWAEQLQPYVDRVLRGEVVEYEMTYSFPRTGPQRMQCTFIPERDAQDRVVGWIAALVNVTSMRQAEEDVKNLAHLVETASDFVAIIDLEFRPTYMNAAAAGMFGPASAGPGAVSMPDVFFPEDREMLEQEFFPRVVRDGQAEIETRFRHPQSGDPVWMMYNAVLLRDAHGRPKGYATISRDLTAQKRREDQLREAGRRKDESIAALRQIADSMPQIIWSAGADGRIDYCNRVWYELGGEPPPGDQSDWPEFMHPDDRVRARDVWRVSIQNELPFEMELRLAFDARREYRWYLGRAVPHRGESGAIDRWYATSTDIHDRKLAESALAEHRARLRAALDASDTGTFTWNIETDDFEADESLDRLVGAAPHGSNRSLADFVRLVHPSDQEMVSGAWRASAQGCLEFQNEFRVVWPDGTQRWLYCKGRTVRGDHGRPATMAGACVDVTMRKEREDALLAADRQKDEFLGMLAHELRNPLAPITYCVAALERQMPSPEARRPLEIIARQAARMTRIVDDLLDVSRVTQGKITLQQEPLDLGTIVSNAAEVSRAAMEAHGHLLTVTVPDGPLPISGDAVRLAQVFENLLGNAAKYTPPGGRVTLTVEREGPQGIVRVRDSGIGIGPDVLPRIFDLFVQADTSLDRSEGGLGIGLTLVDRLTRMHGGSVEAFSDGPGSGSEFVVRLPLDVAHAASEHPAGDHDTAGARRHRYLIVDDNVDSADSLRLLLEMRGHSAHVVNDGRLAADAARTFKPDIVLLDVGLPGMDGYQVVRQFRAEPDLATLMVVATTGYGRLEDKLRCLAAGFDQHIAKPLDVEDIEALEPAR